MKHIILCLLYLIVSLFQIILWGEEVPIPRILSLDFRVPNMQLFNPFFPSFVSFLKLMTSSMRICVTCLICHMHTWNTGKYVQVATLQGDTASSRWTLQGAEKKWRKGTVNWDRVGLRPLCERTKYQFIKGKYERLEIKTCMEPRTHCHMPSSHHGISKPLGRSTLEAVLRSFPGIASSLVFPSGTTTSLFNDKKSEPYS